PCRAEREHHQHNCQLHHPSILGNAHLRFLLELTSPDDYLKSSPPFITWTTFARFPMSSRTFPLTTMMSASLPASTVPSSAPLFSSIAGYLVADVITCSGVIPFATSSCISRRVESTWKFMGVPESVPTSIRTPASWSCLQRIGALRIHPGASEK